MAIRRKGKPAGRRPERAFFPLVLGLLLTAAPVICAEGAGVKAAKPLLSVPICSRSIDLSASYLSEARPGEGPGFLFSLTNHTDHEIRLAEPVPSSAHWYALTQGKWLWRASNGAGGSLLDATNERGRLLLYQSPPGEVHDSFFTVPPHQTKNWVESERENPVLDYKPGCPLCSYPGEREYRVVFAYAYLPKEGQPAAGLLPCGLRSKPVPMPPKQR